MVPDARYNVQVETMQQVDLLCSMWFLETSWVRYMFAEAPPDPPGYETGEDFMLSYTLRKYANIDTYVLPQDSRTEFDGNVDSGRELSKDHATTDRSMVTVRNRLYRKLIQRGGRYFLINNRPHNAARFLYYLDPRVDPATFSSFAPFFNKQQAGSATESLMLTAGFKSWSCHVYLKSMGVRYVYSVCLVS
jgi:hypothetical protein